MKIFTLKVQEVRKETHDTITLCFKQPGLKKIKYLSGQYLTLVFRINGRRYIRPYSFSSSPQIDSTLDVTVKRVHGGIVSNYINDTIKVDDLIEVQEPLGDFVFENSQSLKSVIFWGVGSGITPLFSIIKKILVSEPLLNVYLVYGNKYKGSVIFDNQLANLQENYPERFTMYNFYSKEEFFDSHLGNFHGRIDSQFVEHLMNRIEKPTKHYICGPVGLKNTVKESLLELSIDSKDIFSEDFELVKNPEDFKEVSDQEITLNFEGNVYKIVIKKGSSVLEGALEIGLELPYSCQTGSCSTCKASLKLGELKMIGLSKARTDLNKNEFLLCCSYPMSTDVCIEI